MMRLSALLLLCCLPMLAVADNAQLGRLFLTPAERAALDMVRQNSKSPERLVKAGEAAGNEENDTAASAPAPTLPIVTVHGYVKRSDGKGTVWVNGRPVQEKDATKEVEIGRLRGNTNQVQIKLPSTGQTVNLKAGQSYDPASGKVVDNLKDLPHDTITPTVATSPGKALEPTMEKGKGSRTKEDAAAGSAAKSASALPPSR
jgi:hypothetical protein